MDFTKIIEALKASKWGLTALLGGATILVGTGTVGFDTPQAQAAGGGAGIVCAIGAGILAKQVVARFLAPKA